MKFISNNASHGNFTKKFIWKFHCNKVFQGNLFSKRCFSDKFHENGDFQGNFKEITFFYKISLQWHVKDISLLNGYFQGNFNKNEVFKDIFIKMTYLMGIFSKWRFKRKYFWNHYFKEISPKWCFSKKFYKNDIRQFKWNDIYKENRNHVFYKNEVLKDNLSEMSFFR